MLLATKPLGLKLDYQSKIPLHRQLYEQMQKQILQGKLKPGQAVPSSRALAESYGIARITVTQGYKQLISEGYLETKAASKTFVCRQLPDSMLGSSTKKTKPARQAAYSTSAIKTTKKETLSQLSAYANALKSAETITLPDPQPEICFWGWRPALEEAPARDIANLIARYLRQGKREVLDYPNHPFGYEGLRAAIAKFLESHRGIKCLSKEVIVVAGPHQAFDLFERVHLERGDVVALEEPCYVHARQYFTANGQIIRSVPVDDNGLVVERLYDLSREKVKAIYVNPSYQYPTGAVLSLARRLELLSWAQQGKVMIFEDDYDSDFRYAGRPIQALKGLDKHNCVIYVGALSKILFPSLCLGFMVVPEPLVEVYKGARWLAADQLPLFLQYALAEYITSGEFKRHIGRMRRLYKVRRQALVSALERYFGNKVIIKGDEAGLHMLVRFDTTLSTAEIVERAQKVGVGLVSTTKCYSGKAPAGEFLFGFGDLNEKQINEGVRRLAQIIANNKNSKKLTRKQAL